MPISDFTPWYVWLCCVIRTADCLDVTHLPAKGHHAPFRNVRRLHGDGNSRRGEGCWEALSYCSCFLLVISSGWGWGPAYQWRADAWCDLDWSSFCLATSASAPLVLSQRTRGLYCNCTALTITTTLDQSRHTVYRGAAGCLLHVVP